MSSNHPFYRYYYRAIDNGRSEKNAWIYAARKYVDDIYEESGLVADDEVRRDLADDMHEQYEEQLDLGKTHKEAWGKISRGLRTFVEKEAKYESRDRRRRTRDAFAHFDDMMDSLPVHEEGLPRVYAHVMNSRSHAPQPQPPMPAGQGRYRFPTPEYPGYTMRSDPYEPRGGDRSYHPAPSMPANHGSHAFPAPEYSHERSHVRESENYDSGRGYNTREYRPHEEPRSARRESYYRETQPRYEIREPASSRRASARYETREPASPHRPSRHHETREPKSPRHSSRRHEKPERSSSRQRARHEPREPRPSSSRPPPFEDFSNDPRPDACFYVVLGITSTASQDEIKKAFRKMSLKHHPDRAPAGGKTAATDKMAEINHANDILSDPDARAYYDQTGRYKSR